MSGDVHTGDQAACLPKVRAKAFLLLRPVGFVHFKPITYHLALRGRMCLYVSGTPTSRKIVCWLGRVSLSSWTCNLVSASNIDAM